MPTPVRWSRSRVVAWPHDGTRRPIRAFWNWPRRATSRSVGPAGQAFVTAVRAGWFRAKSSTGRSHSKRPPTATFSFAAHSRFATSSSISDAFCSLWPQVEDQGRAYQTEGDARRDERNQHGGHEARKDNE